MKIEDICKKYGIAFYTINPDGSIDVDGNVLLDEGSLDIRFYHLNSIMFQVIFIAHITN